MLEGFTIEYDVTLADADYAVWDAWQRGWTIPPKLTLSQWADAHRQIAKGAGAEPGQWRTSRNPILREIMDALSDHSPVRLIDFKKSAQIGATEIGINWVGYVIHRGLDSMIVAQPVKDLARSWATTKFDPAVALMPDLQARIDNDNTLEKRYPGGTAWVIWANSSNQLRQRTARFIFMDEVDEYPSDLGDQGGADEQLAARALSFGDRAKVYRACTPTVEGRSKIDAGFKDGDQRYYNVPCPDCGWHQVLHRDNLQPNGTFACVKNGCIIEERHKVVMFAERSACAGCGDVPLRVIDHVVEGRPVYADECACGKVMDPPSPDGAFWVPTNPDAPRWHRSYHAWAAYTPEQLGLDWKDIADRKAAAIAQPDKQSAFDNLICGETHAGERKSQEADEVIALAEPGVHRGTVPDGAYLLTAGIDCQHDRFEVQVLGWGRGQRGRVVDYAVIDGDPASPEGYTALDEYLQGVWHNVHGRAMHLAAIAIDGGNWTEMVAQFVKKAVSFSGSHRMVKIGDGYRRQHVYLIRGRAEKKSDRAVYRPKKTEVNARDKTLARSVGIWGVGTSVIKHLIYGWIGAAIAAKAEADKVGDADPIEARMLRFPGGRGEEHNPLQPDPGALPRSYYDGLVVEYFDLDAQVWIKPRGARNEPLDTLVYAYFAALSPALKIDVMRESQWAALESAFRPDPTDLFSADSRETSTQSPLAPAAMDSRGTSPKPARRSGWGTNGGNKRGWGE